jgi:LacI family transcriptional regulator
VLNHSALTSKETREQVLKAVAELGYRPNANAQALARRAATPSGWW